MNNAVCFNLFHDAPRSFFTGVIVFNPPMVAANDEDKDNAA